MSQESGSKALRLAASFNFFVTISGCCRRSRENPNANVYSFAKNRTKEM